MAINWERDRNAQLWRSASRADKETDAMLSRAGATRTRKASDRQIDYLQALLQKAGRRPYTDAEVAILTVDSASRLIKSLAP